MIRWADLLQAFMVFGEATVCIIALAIWWAAMDNWLIKKTWGTSVLDLLWHRQRWFLKAASVVLFSFFIIPVTNPSLPLTLLLLALYGLYVASLWWLVFDDTLNRLRSLNRFYIGMNARTDGVLGWIVKRTGWSHQYAYNRVKLPLVFTSALLFFLAIYYIS